MQLSDLQLKEILIIVAASAAFGLAGCSTESAGGAAVGAVGAGAAYEYQMQAQLDELEEQRERGEIDQAEYERRRKEIEERSVVQ